MKKDKNKLIISADDFGINVNANRNVLKLVKFNKLDRVGILVNGNYTEKEISLLLKSGIKIDLHLNATENKLPRNCEKRGILHRSVKFITRFISGKTGAGVMRMEWEKQIEKFVTIFGRQPDGLNSHEYVHFLPAYFKIIVNLAKIHNISYLRFGEMGIIKCPNGVSQILNYLHKKNKKTFLESRLKSSSYLISLDWISNLEKKGADFPPGEIEIACHPERVSEMKILMDIKK
jgi:predicted glycoside hydrolase/deacetylase ChbG (UPF0249 family)